MEPNSNCKYSFEFDDSPLEESPYISQIEPCSPKIERGVLLPSKETVEGISEPLETVRIFYEILIIQQVVDYEAALKRGYSIEIGDLKAPPYPTMYSIFNEDSDGTPYQENFLMQGISIHLTPFNILF